MPNSATMVLIWTLACNASAFDGRFSNNQQDHHWPRDHDVPHVNNDYHLPPDQYFPQGHQLPPEVHFSQGQHEYHVPTDNYFPQGHHDYQLPPEVHFSQSQHEYHVPPDHYFQHGHHYPHGDYIPHNHHLPPDHRWSFAEHVDNDYRPQSYDGSVSYDWLEHSSWDNDDWSPNQEIKLTTISPNTMNSPPQPQRDAIIQCINSCAVTNEYNPVCGTNHLTYFNLGKLECARYCGVDVALLTKSSCQSPPAQNLPTATATATTTSTTVIPPELTIDERFKEMNTSNDSQ